ncbi:MAG: serine/threonine-protein kinase, partial [Planctomycetota bacterium]
MTDADRQRRLHDLFVEASERAGPERDALLHRVDEQEPALGPALRRLLDAEQAVEREGFLDSGSGGPGLWPVEGEVDPDLGRSVGPYRLLRLLGTGGMGRVYLAERRDEFEQIVAIKLLRPDMDTEELLERFRVERQTMAALDHPNIARLLDGGTDDGRPYFVMEYVDGVRIDEYCDHHDLPVRDRVALLATVCDAVGHAHENIVVHRDIKPANILVTADGQPKLVDFGLARLVNPVIGAARAEPAAGGPRFVTASYASPEQLAGGTVGRPADVWSLGVILYELLTGRPPFELAGRGHPEVERVLRHTRPEPPSRVVRHPEPDERETNLHGRAADRRELSRALAGDLDAIVRRALQPVPRTRYPDAGAMGDDLRRWLRHEPVAARRETVAYLVARFVRRNRTLVALNAAVVLALAAGLVGTTVAMRRAIDERDRAAAATAGEIEARLAAAEAERGAEAARRRSLSKRLGGEVLL